MGFETTIGTGPEALEPVELNLSEFETPEADGMDDIAGAMFLTDEALKAAMEGTVEGMEMAKPSRSDKDLRNDRRETKQERQAREHAITKAIKNGTYTPPSSK